jgi:hypothetical protein
MPVSRSAFASIAARSARPPRRPTAHARCRARSRERARPAAPACRASRGRRHRPVAVHAVGQRGLLVLLEEEARIGQARTHHPLVAVDDQARSAISMFDTIRKRAAAGLRIEQREVLLVGAHREDQAFLRHLQEFASNSPDVHGRPFDQRGDLVEQGLDLRSRRPATRASRVPARAAAPRCARAAWRSRAARGLRARAHGTYAFAASGTVSSPELWNRWPWVVRPECSPSTCRRDDIGTVQHDQPMGRPHEAHARGAAVGQLVLHQLGDRQPHERCDQQDASIAPARVSPRCVLLKKKHSCLPSEARTAARRARPAFCAHFSERLGGLALGIEPTLVDGPLSSTARRRPGAARRRRAPRGGAACRSARDRGVGAGQPARADRRRSPAAECVAQALQRLWWEFFGEQLDRAEAGHSFTPPCSGWRASGSQGARASRSTPARPRARAGARGRCRRRAR